MKGAVLRIALCAALGGLPIGWWFVQGTPHLPSAPSARTLPRDEAFGGAGASSPARAGSVAVGRAAPQTRSAPGSGRPGGGVGIPWWPIAAVCVLLVGLGTLRLRARARRQVVRYRIAVPRADHAGLEQVAGLIETWHRIAQRERALVRLLFGQPHLALEWHSLPDAQAGGRPEVVLCVVCPPELSPELDASLAACWPNARLGYEFAPPAEPWGPAPTWTRAMLRLEKSRPSYLRAGTLGERGEHFSAVETAMAIAGARASAVGVQIRLAPAPRLLERLARLRLEGRERALEQRRRRSAPLERRELEGGLQLQHRALFYAEVWVLADEEASLRAVAGALEAAGGENPLRPRRAWNPLHRRRVARAQPGLLSARPMGAAEVACLWHLPSPAALAVAVSRSSLPRLPVPREVARTPDLDSALLDVGQGGVTLRPADRALGLGILGMPGGGKSSLLLALIRQVAREPDTALFVFDPKSDLARGALSVIPPDRPVWCLNLARPEFGINPLEAEADPDAIADAFISALQDINEEGAIRASSDRYLRLAVLGALAHARAERIRPTLWLVAELLDPGAEELRERVVRACQSDPELANVATFFGRTLPEQLRGARSMTTTKLDAPINKLQRFLGQTAHEVLHHPVQLAVEEVVRRREILVIDGAMGEVGEDTSRKLMQIITRLIFAALQRQQRLSPADRAPIVIPFDEGHFILNDTFAKMAAVGRSGGLQPAAALQQSAQIPSPLVRASVDELLQHRVTFRASAEDSREAAVQAMAAFADVIRDDPKSRERQRVRPDDLINLPDHHCLCSWVVGGRRAPAFLARTIPIAEDPVRIEMHLDAQRRRPTRNGLRPHWPAEMPDPLNASAVPARPQPQASKGAPPTPPRTPEHEAGRRAAPAAAAEAPPLIADAGPAPAPEGDEAPSAMPPAPPHASDAPAEEPATIGSPAGTHDPHDENEASVDPEGARGLVAEAVVREPDPAQEPQPGAESFSPAERPPERQPRADRPSVAQRERREAAPPGRTLAAGAPESYVEVQIDDPLGLAWDEPALVAPDEVRPPRPAELEVLRLLYKAGFLLGSQLARELGWESERTARQALLRLVQYGWIARFRFRVAERGPQPFVYVLRDAGFRVAREHVSRHGPYVAPDEGWSAPQVKDPRRVLHDLHAAGWVLAAQRSLTPKVARTWHGARSPLARPKVPTRGREERHPIRAGEIAPARDRWVCDLQAERFEAVAADALLELVLELPEGRERIDLFVELDRTRKPARNFPKFRNYDAFITAWSRAIGRYKGVAPMVVFVCDDEPQARAFVRAADAQVTGRLSTLRTAEQDWEYPGRERMRFVCERDVHEGSLRAWRLPRLPPDVRGRLGLERAPEPEQVQILDPDVIARAGRAA